MTMPREFSHVCATRWNSSEMRRASYSWPLHRPWPFMSQWYRKKAGAPGRNGKDSGSCRRRGSTCISNPNAVLLGVRLRCITNDFSLVAIRHNHKLGGVHRGWGCRKACQYPLRYRQPDKCGLALISLQSVNTDCRFLHQVRTAISA